MSVNDELHSELCSIIENEQLTTLFQPIVENASGKIFGYEALTRGPSDSPLHAPGCLFSTAQTHGLLSKLERLIWRRAWRAFSDLHLPGRLFLNTSPCTLMKVEPMLKLLHDPELEPPLDPGVVVIEITEQSPIDDYAALQSALQEYRAHGFSIAIDDLGAGYSGLRLWSEIQPDLVKLDMHFIQGIHKDPVKQEFVRSIRDIARGIRCRVVAEGIESQEELDAVRELNIQLGQGYHYAKPKQRPPLRLKKPSYNEKQRFSSRYSEKIGKLVHTIPTVSSNTTLGEVMPLFKDNENLQSVPVVEDGIPLGMLRHSRIINLLSATPYARDLHGRKPVRRFMDSQPLMFDHDMGVEQVSQQVTDRLNFEFESEFFITKGGYYLGVGRVRDLLKTITKLQIRNARHANPLTQLPGNVIIDEHIERLLSRGDDFIIAYCDLDHFKPFNDQYGFKKGDDVIRLLGSLLNAHIDGDRDFIGHIGGDDFIAVMQSTDWEKRLQSVLDDFLVQTQEFFDRDSLIRGGYHGVDRGGNTTIIPLLSLSIGVVQPDPMVCTCPHDVAALASDAKKMAKKEQGNSLYVDRRRMPVYCSQGMTTDSMAS